MKLREIALTPPIMAISVALVSGSLFGAAQKDFYVSTNDLHEVSGVVWGTYVTDDGVAHDAYTNLQEAITANYKSQNTIWVEDGFVCDVGGATKDGTGSRITTPAVYSVDAVVIRSRSGKWETGAEIRGRYHSEEDPCGTNSIRCVAPSCGAKFVGFRFVGGSTTGNGGGLIGGTYGFTLENCLVENCVAKGSGGGVFQGGTRNYTDSMSTRLINCTVRNNRTINGNGGGVYAAHLISCQLYGNICGGTGWSTGCGGGMAYSTSSVQPYTIVVSNCVFHGNSASNPDQVSHASRQAGCGGGLYLVNYRGRVYNCVFSNNTATAWGGGVNHSTSVETYNSIFSGNSSTGQSGGGIYGGVHYGALVTGNKAKSAGGVFAHYSAYSQLINCTVTGNEITGTAAPYEAGYVVLTNSVVWSDTAGKIAVVNNVSGCSHSCYPTATEGENGNTVKNPKLRTMGGKAYAATSIRCKGKGVEFDWMTDPADVRSKDWYGDPRILGDGPDMGWVSLKKNGLMLFVR